MLCVKLSGLSGAALCILACFCVISVKPVGPSNVLSMAQLRTLPLVDQVKTLMKNGGVTHLRINTHLLLTQMLVIRFSHVCENKRSCHG